jgi:2',3'-cyclic-nucleotide 2'-phosphodiesterase (5'-nucleotidase family)
MVRSAHRRSVVLQASSTPPQQRLSLIHFNDVYNIDSRTVEPVGGAARLAHLVRRLQAEEGALVLFSGDCLNPSLLSAFTSGSQMVPILNSIGVNAAVVGNHGASIACVLCFPLVTKLLLLSTEKTEQPTTLLRRF